MCCVRRHSLRCLRNEGRVRRYRAGAFAKLARFGRRGLRKKAGQARRQHRDLRGAPGQSDASTRALKLLLASLLLLGFLGLLRLLRLLRFLSHSILVRVRMVETRYERHARRRASLATSSIAELSRFAGRCARAVTSPSSRYPQMLCLLPRFCESFRRIWRMSAGAGRSPVDGFASRLTPCQRALHQFKTTARIEPLQLRVR